MDTASQNFSEERLKFGVLALIFEADHYVSDWRYSEESLSFPNRISPDTQITVKSCELMMSVIAFAIFPLVWLSVVWQTVQFICLELEHTENSHMTPDSDMIYT